MNILFTFNIFVYFLNKKKQHQLIINKNAVFNGIATIARVYIETTWDSICSQTTEHHSHSAGVTCVFYKRIQIVRWISINGWHHKVLSHKQTEKKKKMKRIFPTNWYWTFDCNEMTFESNVTKKWHNWIRCIRWCNKTVGSFTSIIKNT